MRSATKAKKQHRSDGKLVMFTLGTTFKGAKYYDKVMKLYMDELPDHYYEKKRRGV
jgi:hypothetical protein